MSREIPEGVDLQKLRGLFDGAYMANNGYTAELAREVREHNQADLICFGRPFMANPDLVERLKVGAELVETPRESYYGGDERGYTDWPNLAGVVE
jgi:N-ethylmaleimide reductase